MENLATQEKAFIFDETHPKVQKFYNNCKSHLKMRLYQLMNVPGAFWFRFRVEEVNKDRAVVSIPLTWRTKNPFKSIYFIGQMGCAEYASAMFVFSRVATNDDIQYIVKSASADFTKKAGGRTYFTCDEAGRLDEAINLALTTGEQQEVPFKMIGKLENGDVVSEITVTWTFRKKRKK